MVNVLLTAKLVAPGLINEEIALIEAALARAAGGPTSISLFLFGPLFARTGRRLTVKPEVVSLDSVNDYFELQAKGSKHLSRSTHCGTSLPRCMSLQFAHRVTSLLRRIVG